MDDKSHWDYPADDSAEYRDTTPWGTKAVRVVKRIVGTVPAAAKVYAWLHYVVLRNYASRDQGCGENVGSYVKAFDYAGGDIWGTCTEVADMSFGAKYGTLRGHETSIAANGPDPHQWRIGHHMMASNSRQSYDGGPGGESAEVGIAHRINGGPNSYFGTVFQVSDFAWAAGTFTGGYCGLPSHHIFKFGGHYVTGFSFADAKFDSSPIRLGRGQTIGLESTDSVRIGLDDRDRIAVTVQGRRVFELDIWTGDVGIAGSLRKIT